MNSTMYDTLTEVWEKAAQKRTAMIVGVMRTVARTYKGEDGEYAINQLAAVIEAQQPSNKSESEK